MHSRQMAQALWDDRCVFCCQTGGILAEITQAQIRSPTAILSRSPGNMDSVWERSINRWQKVLRMNQVWWNCCIEMDAAAKQFVEERSSMLKC